MKYYLFAILGLIFSMSNNLQSYIDKEIKDAVRKSNPETLELLLSEKN